MCETKVRPQAKHVLRKRIGSGGHATTRQSKLSSSTFRLRQATFYGREKHTRQGPYEPESTMSAARPHYAVSEQPWRCTDD